MSLQSQVNETSRRLRECVKRVRYPVLPAIEKVKLKGHSRSFIQEEIVERYYQHASHFTASRAGREPISVGSIVGASYHDIAWKIAVALVGEGIKSELLSSLTPQQLDIVLAGMTTELAMVKQSLPAPPKPRKKREQANPVRDAVYAVLDKTPMLKNDEIQVRVENRLEQNVSEDSVKGYVSEYFRTFPDKLPANRRKRPTKRKT